MAGDDTPPRTFDRLIADITAFDRALADYERDSAEMPLGGSGWGGGESTWHEDVGEGARITNERRKYLDLADVAPIRDICEAHLGEVNRTRLIHLGGIVADAAGMDRDAVRELKCTVFAGEARRVLPSPLLNVRNRPVELPIVRTTAQGASIEWLGVQHPVKLNVADAFRLMLNAKGRAVGIGAILNGKPKRAIAALPEPLQAIIAREGNKGYRLTIFG